MRDLLLLAVILPMVPLCAARPWIGVLVWSWLGGLNPHRVVVLKVLLRHHIEAVEAENRRPAAMPLGREPLAAGVE